jgi:hypothetical protein
LKRARIFITVLTCQLLLSVSAASVTYAQKDEIKIRGFVTALSSQNSFAIADYQVTRGRDVALEFQDNGPDVTFRPEDFRVGIEVEVRGVYNEQTHELQARKIRIDLDQFRKLRQTVVLDRKPESLERVGENWRAVLWAGGRRLRIEPTTKVEFRLSKIEQEDVARSAKEKETSGRLHTLSSLEEVGPNVLLTFEGAVRPDGTVLAERAEFRRNEREKNEEGLWKMFKAKVKTPRDDEQKPSTLKIAFSIVDADLKLLPEDVQDYVSKVGRSLVPAYQRAMPEAELTRIPFEFYAVERPEPFALSLPNGVVVVSSGLFAALENEAQLASMMAREVAHIVQKHNLRQWEASAQKRLSLALGRAGSYSQVNHVQADRLALEYLLRAGYDLHEAPRAWKLIADKVPAEAELLVTRRSSLMVALMDTYSQTGASGLRKNEAEFRQMQRRVREAVLEFQAKQKK